MGSFLVEGFLADSFLVEGFWADSFLVEGFLMGDLLAEGLALGVFLEGVREGLDGDFGFEFSAFELDYCWLESCGLEVTFFTWKKVVNFELVI